MVSSLVSKGWEANICTAPALQKSVTPTYSEKVSRRDTKRIKLLKALWKSVAGKEVQIIPLRGKRWAERCPVSGLVEITSSNTEHGERYSICRGSETFIGNRTSCVPPLTALILHRALFSGFAIL